MDDSHIESIAQIKEFIKVAKDITFQGAKTNEFYVAYLNKVSTLCASCKWPIFPGTPVGQAWHGAPHPFTQLTENFSIISKDLYFSAKDV